MPDLYFSPHRNSNISPPLCYCIPPPSAALPHLIFAILRFPHLWKISLPFCHPCLPFLTYLFTCCVFHLFTPFLFGFRCFLTFELTILLLHFFFVCVCFLTFEQILPLSLSNLRLAFFPELLCQLFLPILCSLCIPSFVCTYLPSHCFASYVKNNTCLVTADPSSSRALIPFLPVVCLSA